MSNHRGNMTVDDPVFKEKVFKYLDALRESGIINMYGGGPYIREEFLVDKATSHKLLKEWMDTFSERHKEVK